MKFNRKSLLSLLLAMYLLFSSIVGTNPVAANPVDTATSSMSPDNFTEIESVGESSENSENVIVQEDVSLRGTYEKHFLLSERSYQVALYSEPVHQMKNGTWEEIDNTLNLCTTANGTAQYRTANGLTDVSFAQSFDNRLVTMQRDDYSISWGVQAISGSSGKLTTESTELRQSVQAELLNQGTSGESQLLSAKKSTSSIQYRNALRENVDLEYIVLPSRVKENIILQSPQDIDCFIVTVHTQNLSARLLENRQIEFFNDTDEVVFKMDAPYMYDSAAELSENISMEMIPKENGCYLIKMTPDAQWLKEES